MLKACLYFVLGLILLIKGGDWFVDGASAIAKRFKVPEILIGATIVSVGTTLPEVLVSSEAALIGHGSIAYGNAIGSIICNTALISAITITLKPGVINKKSLTQPVIFFFVTAILYAVVAYVVGDFTRPIGIMLLVIYAIYMFVNIRNAFKGNKTEVIDTGSDMKIASDAPEENGDRKAEKVSFLVRKVPQLKKHPLFCAILYLILGAACIAFGADLLVDNGIIIAEGLGVPETVVALIFVALGTSLPELVTAITALAKGHSGLSVGNIIGANFFNLALVSGLATTLSPFEIPADKLIGGMNASLVIDIPLMILVMIIMTVPTLIKGKLSRWQGILLLALYAGYCIFQFAG